MVTSPTLAFKPIPAIVRLVAASATITLLALTTTRYMRKGSHESINPESRERPRTPCLLKEKFASTPAKTFDPPRGLSKSPETTPVLRTVHYHTSPTPLTTGREQDRSLARHIELQPRYRLLPRLVQNTLKYPPSVPNISRLKMEHNRLIVEAQPEHLADKIPDQFRQLPASNTPPPTLKPSIWCNPRSSG